MNVFLFYILRKFFIDLDITEKRITLRRGLLIRRSCSLPLSAVTKLTVRRTPLLRLLGGKEVTVLTLGGGLRFYLREREPLPFAAPRSLGIRPRFRDVMFGAFIDTRALGGLFVFSAALRRTARIFGEVYLRKVLELIDLTARNIETALIFFRLTVPKMALTAAAFALGSWVFVYVLKLARLARFRVSKGRSFIYIRSGIFTLYEHFLVPNTALLSVDTFSTLIISRAPLYCRGEMLLPCVKREKLPKAIELFLGAKPPELSERPPLSAFFGHIAPPLWCAVFFGAVCRAVSSELLKTAACVGCFVSSVAAALYFLYMYGTGTGHENGMRVIGARRGLRLVTAVFADGLLTRGSLSQSLFQRRSGRFDLKLSVLGEKPLSARRLPLGVNTSA